MGIAQSRDDLDLDLDDPVSSVPSSSPSSTSSRATSYSGRRLRHQAAKPSDLQFAPTSVGSMSRGSFGPGSVAGGETGWYTWDPNKTAPAQSPPPSASFFAFEVAPMMPVGSAMSAMPLGSAMSVRVVAVAAPPRSANLALARLRPKPCDYIKRTPDGKADFRGEWLCSAVEGDVEAFMESLDLGWGVRSAAYLISYGVGAALRNIRQSEDIFEIEATAGPVEFFQSFSVGRGPQHTEGPDGDVLVNPIWESPSVLLVDQQALEGSNAHVAVRQYFCSADASPTGEDLVVHMTSRGTSAAWIFQRI